MCFGMNFTRDLCLVFCFLGFSLFLLQFVRQQSSFANLFRIVSKLGGSYPAKVGQELVKFHSSLTQPFTRNAPPAPYQSNLYIVSLLT